MQIQFFIGTRENSRFCWVFYFNGFPESLTSAFFHLLIDPSHEMYMPLLCGILSHLVSSASEYQGSSVHIHLSQGVRGGQYHALLLYLALYQTDVEVLCHCTLCFCLATCHHLEAQSSLSSLQKLLCCGPGISEKNAWNQNNN